MSRIVARASGLTFAATLGALAGFAVFIFWYGRGDAYLRDDPSACATCHVMQESFDSWQKSGHRHVATCNGCHLPPGPIEKWLTKIDNGMLHSLAFTTGRFPEPITIKGRNARRTQHACLACHDGLFHASVSPSQAFGGDELRCAHCHADAGHGMR